MRSSDVLISDVGAHKMWVASNIQHMSQAHALFTMAFAQ